MVKAIEGLADFTAISIKGSADVEFVQADSCKVIVKANQQVFEHLNYYVTDGVLYIETKDNVLIKAKTYDICIQVPEVESIKVDGAADLEFKGTYVSKKDLALVVNGAGDMEIAGLNVPALNVRINGAADMELENISVKNLSVDINGAGDIDISGKAESAKFSVNGAGDIDAKELQCDNIETSKAGLASINL